jgi:hypothetical protein
MRAVVRVRHGGAGILSRLLPASPQSCSATLTLLQCMLPLVAAAAPPQPLPPPPSSEHPADAAPAPPPPAKQAHAVLHCMKRCAACDF